MIFLEHYENEEMKEEFQVYNVVDATRKIEADLQRMIDITRKEIDQKKGIFY